MVGVDLKRRRQFRRPRIWLAIIDQHIAENRMRAGIFRVERHGALGCGKGKRAMGFRGFSPVRPAAKVAHREPGVCIREARIEFD